MTPKERERRERIWWAEAVETFGSAEAAQIVLDGLGEEELTEILEGIEDEEG